MLFHSEFYATHVKKKQCRSSLFHSKSVADLKARFPVLQENVERAVGLEMDRLASEERFLKTEPERLENALKRCKKLTGTLVTLKRYQTLKRT